MKIEQHPSLPVLSVSGIDHTVKVRAHAPHFKGSFHTPLQIFAPTSGSRRSSRMAQKDDIVKANTSTAETSLRLSRQRMQLSHLVMHYRRAWSRMEDTPEDAECVYQ